MRSYRLCLSDPPMLPAMQLAVTGLAHANSVGDRVRTALLERNDVMDLEIRSARIGFVRHLTTRLTLAGCLLQDPGGHRRIADVRRALVRSPASVQEFLAAGCPVPMRRSTATRAARARERRRSARARPPARRAAADGARPTWFGTRPAARIASGTEPHNRLIST